MLRHHYLHQPPGGRPGKMNAKQRHGDKSHRLGWRGRLHHQQGAQRRQHQTDNNRRFAGFRLIVASARQGIDHQAVDPHPHRRGKKRDRRHPAGTGQA